MNAVLLIHAAATWLMTGIIWFVQIVHYPLFRRVGAEGFTAYEAEHQRRTTRVVAPTMLIELVTAGLLVWQRPPNLPGWAVWSGLGLVALAWACTAGVSVPRHRSLSRGFDRETVEALVRTNWPRTLAWSLRSALAAWMIARVMP